MCIRDSSCRNTNFLHSSSGYYHFSPLAFEKMSSPATNHLSETHSTQIHEFLKFFQGKIEEQQKEVDAVFEEQKDMRLLEEMYSVDDVTSLLNSIQEIVRSNVRSESTKYSHQVVLYLRNIFLQAEGYGVQLQVDTAQLEDAVLLAGIEKLELDLKKKASVSLADLPDPSRKKLDSLAGQAVDIKLVQQVKELQDANKSLLAKFEQLQKQLSHVQKENSELKEKNSLLQDKFSDSNRDLENLKSNNKSAQQQEIDSLRSELTSAKEAAAAQVSELKAQMKALENDLNNKVNNSPQYQQLKKLMQTKNEQLKEARNRVKQLEEHLNKA